MICVSLGNIDFDKAISIASGKELVEIRADLLHFDQPQLSALMKASRKFVFTCRKGDYSQEERKEMFSLAISAGADFIDLDIENDPAFIDDIRKLLINSKTELIVSYHNFERTPEIDDLSQILTNCYEKGAAVAKLATMVNNNEELKTIFSLYRIPGRKVIVGMGEMGIITRIAGPVMGSEFTFASIDAEKTTAPGQVNIDDMKDIFKILKIK